MDGLPLQDGFGWPEFEPLEARLLLSTTVSGIPDDFQWTADEGPFVLAGSVTVPSDEPFTDDNGDGLPDETDGNGQWDPGEPFEDYNGSGSRDEHLTLTIGAGVEVQFPVSGYRINVSGTLQAVGASFTGAGSSYPRLVADAGGALELNGCTFSGGYVDYRDGASGSLAGCEGNIQLTAGSGDVSVTGSTLWRILLAGGPTTVTGNTFTSDLPIVLSDPDRLGALANVAGNTYTYAEAKIGLQGSLDAAATMGVVDGLDTYCLTSSLRVEAGAALTVHPGVTVYFGGPGWQLDVYGSLNATGAAFTGVSTSSPDLDVGAGAALHLAGCTFSGGQIDYATGSSGSITACEGYLFLTVASGAVSIADSTLARVTVTGGVPSVTGNTLTNYHPLFLFDPDQLPALGGVSGNTYTASEPEIGLRGNLDGAAAMAVVDGLSTYCLTGPLRVEAGAALSIGPGVEVRFPGTGHAVAVYGTLSATGTGFGQPGSSYPDLDVHAGGALHLAGCDLAGADVAYKAGSRGSVAGCEGMANFQVDSGDVSITASTLVRITLTGGAPLVTGNTIASYQPFVLLDPDRAPALGRVSGNTYTAGEPEIGIRGLVDGSASLGIVDGLDTYCLNDDLRVQAGAALTINPGVTVHFPSSSHDLDVYGTLNAGRARFVSGTGGAQPELVARSGGAMNLSGCTLAGGTVTYADGSSGRAEHNALTQASIHSGADVAFHYNDLSAGFALVTGSPADTVDLERNWWGTTDPDAVEARVVHHADDPSRPWADYEPFLSGLAERPDTYLGAEFLGTLPGPPLFASDFLGDGDHAEKDVDFFCFELTQADTVHVDLDARAVGSSLDAYLRLFDADGREIAHRDDGDGFDPYLSISLAPGTYYLGVSGSPNRCYDPAVAGSGVDACTTGDYALTVTAESAAAVEWEPTILASAQHDGDPDPLVFGRYLTGALVPDLANTITAHVSAPPGYTTSAVTFDSNFDGTRDEDDHTDTSAADEWTWELNVSALDAGRTLRIWAQESGGEWSEPAEFSIDVLTAPGWLDAEMTKITFGAAGYRIRTLVGKRFGVYTPESWPRWLSRRDGDRTFNGIYFGTAVEADYALSGRVTRSEIAPAFGFSVLGVGPQFKLPLAAKSGSVTIDPYEFWRGYKDPGGFLGEPASSPGDGGLGRLEFHPPKVTFSWSQDYTLNDDLAFGHLTQTFSIGLDAEDLFGIRLPSFLAPIGPTGLNLAVTPHFGFGPYFDASWTTALSGGWPCLTQADVEIGAGVSIGAATELQVAAGLISGGLDTTASGRIGFAAGLSGGGWSLSIPATLGITIDFIGSVLWGKFSGRFNLAEFSVSTDLLGGGGGAGSAATSPAAPAAGQPDRTLLSPAVAHSGGGDVAVAWVEIDPAGEAGALSFRQRPAGAAWGEVETIAAGDRHRGEPALAYLPDGRLMALWSESALPAPTVPALDDEAVLAAQEILWSVRGPGGWSAPQGLTADGLLDDQPALAVLSDGTAVAAWRHASPGDVDLPEASDLAWATFDGAAWSAPAVLTDDANANGRPALAALPSGEVLVLWLRSPTTTGEAADVVAATWDGQQWSAPADVSAPAGAPRAFPQLAVLPDGQALAFWTEQADLGERLQTAARDPVTGLWAAPQPILTEQKLIAQPVVTRHGSRVDVVWHGVGRGSHVYAVSRDFATAAGWTAPRLLSQGADHAWWPLAGSDDLGRLDCLYLDDPEGAGFQAVDTACLPDLRVSPADLSLAQPPAEPGQPNAVAVVVANDGLAPSGPGDFGLYDGDPAADGTLIGTALLPGLAVGEHAELVIPWTPVEGPHVLWAVVDEADAIDELDTANNVAAAAFACLGVPTVALDPASDTGTAGDGRTVDTTPTLSGTAPAGTTVAVFVDERAAPSAWADAPGGTYAATLPELTNGGHTIRVRAYDASGSPSAASEPLDLFIDRAALDPPGAPRLASASDSGLCGDGVTNVSRPQIKGSAKPLTAVTVWCGEAVLGEAVATIEGTYCLAPPADLDEGCHGITATWADASGNESPASPPLALVIDRTGPRAELVLPAGRVLPEGTTSLLLNLDEPVIAFGPADLDLAEVGTGHLPPDGVALAGDGQSATVSFLGGLPAAAAAETYTLTVRDSVTDRAGNALDGDGAGAPGGDYAVRFSVAVPGDADVDGTVGFLDYFAVKTGYGAGAGAAWQNGDFDGDEDVDLADYLAGKDNFGRSVAAGAADALAIDAPSTDGRSTADTQPADRARSGPGPFSGGDRPRVHGHRRAGKVPAPSSVPVNAGGGLDRAAGAVSHGWTSLWFGGNGSAARSRPGIRPRPLAAFGGTVRLDGGGGPGRAESPDASAPSQSSALAAAPATSLEIRLLPLVGAGLWLR